jgi:hypothetical protein
MASMLIDPAGSSTARRAGMAWSRQFSLNNHNKVDAHYFTFLLNWHR